MSQTFSQSIYHFILPDSSMLGQGFGSVSNGQQPQHPPSAPINGSNQSGFVVDHDSNRTSRVQSTSFKMLQRALATGEEELDHDSVPYNGNTQQGILFACACSCLLA